MTGRIPEDMTLAIYATSKGFAYVLFHGPSAPFDWGIRGISNPSRNRKCLEAISKLVEEYQPLSIVLEDTSEKDSRRTSRIRRLYQAIIQLATANAIDVHGIEKTAIKRAFGSVGAVTKYEIAQAIAIQIPAFAARLPRARKPWMSQDERQCLFDAAALGIAWLSGQSEIPTALG